MESPESAPEVARANSISQIGQRPKVGCLIFGCIGQVYIVSAWSWSTMLADPPAGLIQPARCAMPIEIRNKIPASSAAARNIPDEIQRESHQFQDFPVRVWAVVVSLGSAFFDSVSGFVVIVVTP